MPGHNSGGMGLWERAAIDLFHRWQGPLGLPDAYLKSLQNAVVPLARYFAERSEHLAERSEPGGFRPDVLGKNQSGAVATSQAPMQSAPLVVGLSAAQGCGKTTACHFVSELLRKVVGLSVAVLSLDDFYLTQAERVGLAASVHPLLRTRGVPGTHAVGLLQQTLRKLQTIGHDESVHWPRFDKLADDRCAPEQWHSVCGEIDVILLEGWCVGATCQTEGELAQPINRLELLRDSDGSWRRYVNSRLADDYRELFETIHALVFLGGPSMECIVRWRLQQEQALADKAATKRVRAMSPHQVNEFVQNFERISRHMLRTTPQIADVVIEVARDHELRAPSFAT